MLNLPPLFRENQVKYHYSWNLRDIHLYTAIPKFSPAATMKTLLSPISASFQKFFDKYMPLCLLLLIIYKYNLCYTNIMVTNI